MNQRTYTFVATMIDTVPSFETFPLYDEYRHLVGSFLRFRGDLIKGFVSGSDTPIGLKVSSGDKFYLTPVLDKEGCVAHAVVSELRSSETSVEVVDAQERGTDVEDTAGSFLART